jgi:hypothetical protein
MGLAAREVNSELVRSISLARVASAGRRTYLGTACKSTFSVWGEHPFVTCLGHFDCIGTGPLTSLSPRGQRRVGAWRWAPSAPHAPGVTPLACATPAQSSPPPRGRVGCGVTAGDTQATHAECVLRRGRHAAAAAHTENACCRGAPRPRSFAARALPSARPCAARRHHTALHACFCLRSPPGLTRSCPLVLTRLGRRMCFISPQPAAPPLTRQCLHDCARTTAPCHAPCPRRPVSGLSSPTGVRSETR